MDKGTEENRSSIGHYVIRLLLTALVLAATSFLTPGFSIVGLWSMLLAAVVITIVDSIVESFFKEDASPFGKGFKGFVIAAIIIYATQFVVPNMNVSIIGAILAAVVVGIIDAFLPGRVM
ncbi:phage holin family protein [Clostridium tetani]|uniref:phage holin family protein n=1 Tax=Clostridium tetani TaxID=1513 RepID=UPI00100BB23F|nr:phage holin family protein [Clostridium tetani]RXM78609.1 phage holin family protein [Clostridium tetani]RYU99791.1 phage holin family protein [Clostridium tetani]